MILSIQVVGFVFRSVRTAVYEMLTVSLRVEALRKLDFPLVWCAMLTFASLRILVRSLGTRRGLVLRFAVLASSFAFAYFARLLLGMFDKFLVGVVHGSLKALSKADAIYKSCLICELLHKCLEILLEGLVPVQFEGAQNSVLEVVM